MARTNLTLHLDEDVIRRMRVVAAKRGISVSALVARELAELADEDDRYEQMRARATELMARATPRGGRAWTRDDLYEDRIDRYDV